MPNDYLLTVYVDHVSGERANLQELQKMARDNSELEALTDIQEADLKQALVEHRELKKCGLRPNNRSAALDVFTTLTRLETEVYSYFT